MVRLIFSYLFFLLLISTPCLLFSQCVLTGNNLYGQPYFTAPMTGCLTSCPVNCTITISGGVVTVDENWDFSTIEGVQIIIRPDGGLIFGDGETLTLTRSSSITIDQPRNEVAFALEPDAELTTEIKIDKGPSNSFAGIDFDALNAETEVLPVTLSFFEGNLQDQIVALTWQTATELNNAKFVIETSTEGEVFNRIGEIAGAGTTTEPHNYNFTHQTPSAGANYYRLKQVDFDGTFAYSKVLAINAPGSNDIFAFPNPAKDKITLQYDYSKGAGNIQLFDALGRRLKTNIGGYAGNYEVVLPSGLSKGTYWLKVERGGKIQTVPVVKE